MSITDPLEDVRLVSLANTARALGVSELTVRRMVQDGTFHPLRIRGQTRIDAREVHAFLAAAGADGGA
jgi:excisionase family DNA binding protein